MKDHLCSHIVGIAPSRAWNKANDRIAQWNRPPNEAGLAWNTYQALCRRSKVFIKDVSVTLPIVNFENVIIDIATGSE
ncbi:hypothetical protein PAAG_01819 [Paracoccidioides lutzii Pb01]|uniref:Uncharacterized protein n=1 Tax=Paracoccidioides lutzii (strain ATCC MYA-826 / Pb01) TaxID=502779 RepID=C1GTH4_PARBA|nr:hypothetical protein PAAG_01819 [Paracoccidioides lutzii Pb01]EEH39630.2 hypothetical protein PAAG_01819 [Paracoccidioides lutzii Pb01]